MVFDWIRKATTHWVTGVLAVLGVLSTVWQPAGALVATVWANLGTILPILATAQAQLAPSVEWLSSGALDAALFVVGLLYVVKLGDRVIDAYQRRI